MYGSGRENFTFSSTYMLQLIDRFRKKPVATEVYALFTESDMPVMIHPIAAHTLQHIL